VSGERWLVGLVVEENWRWGVGEAKGSFALLVRVGWCGVRQRIHAVQGGFRRVSFSAAVGFFLAVRARVGVVRVPFHLAFL